MSPVCKMAGNGWLTVGQKVTVVFFYYLLHKLTAIYKERRLQFSLWVMKKVVFLWGFLRDYVFQSGPEHVTQLRSQKNEVVPRAF
jgi:hypothetical protein